MSADVPIRDAWAEKSTATSGGGTATFDVDLVLGPRPQPDRIVRIFAEVYLTNDSASHLNKAAALLAEVVVMNKNGTVTFTTAKTNSSNPINSNTSGFLNTSRVQAADTAFDTSTAVWTQVGNAARLTVTNNGSSGSVNADITVVFTLTSAASA